MPWVKMKLSVMQNSLSDTEDVLLDHHVQSITVVSASAESFLEQTLHELPKWSHVQVEALFALNENLQSVSDTLKPLGVKILDVSFVGDHDWKCTKAHRVESLDFGSLRIVPRGLSEPGTESVVQLDPGLAFGTGEHPTTGMCLSWLASNPPRHSSVLDFGTGSGILGIAAKVLGARLVDAVDIDTLALQTTQSNAQYNEVEISVCETIPEGKRYDLIIVNILLNTILEMEPELMRCLNSSGVILLTGLLQDQIGSVKTAYSDIEFVESLRQEEWCLLVGKRTEIAI